MCIYYIKLIISDMHVCVEGVGVWLLRLTLIVILNE